MNAPDNGNRRETDRRVERVEEQVSVARSELAAVRARIDEHEGDIRAFAPMIVAHSELRSELEYLSRSYDKLMARLDKEAEARAAGQARRQELIEQETQERRKIAQGIEEKRQDDAAVLAETRRAERKRAALALFLGFLSSTAVVVAAILASSP